MIATLIRAVVGFVVVGQLFAVTARTDLLWTLLASRLSHDPSYLATAALFEVDSGTTPARRIAIGDRLFLASLPTPAEGLRPVLLPEGNLRDLVILLERLPLETFDEIILQNGPTLWSDLHPPRVTQDVAIWDMAERDGVSLFPLEEARLVFDAAAAWARAPWQDGFRPTRRLANLDQLSFDAAPPELPDLVRVIGRHAPRLRWLADDRQYDRASNPLLFEAFDRLSFSGPGVDIGRFERLPPALSGKSPAQ